MIDLGTVKPGSTIRIPWSSFDKDDGSAITATNYAASDILIYKDGSTTERASTSGFTATTDFDSKTGKHVAVIDLADNTTAGFYSAGSEYMVAIDAVTVDTVTTGGWIARFRIGYPNAVLDTTIATLASQTSFTLTTGPAEDDALNGFTMMAHDVASAVQAGMAYVLDYTGSTKTVTLVAGPTFTMAATDNVSFFPPIQVFGFGGTAGTFAGGRPEVNTTHWLGTAAATPTVAGVPEVDLTHWLGTAAATPTVAGVPEVDITHFGGSAGTFASGIPAVNATQFAGTAYATALAAEVDATWDEVLTGAAHNVNNSAAKLLREASEAIAFTGTAQAGAAGTITLAAGASAVDDLYNGERVEIIEGTGSGQSRLITDYNGTTKVATVDRNWIVNPDNTSVYAIAGADVDIRAIEGSDTAADNLLNDYNGTGYNKANSTIGTATVAGSVTGNVGGNVAGSVGSVTGAVGSVTGNVGGNVAGSVGSVTAEVTPTAASKTGYRLSATGVDDVLDEVVLGSYTLRQLMRGIAAANIGKLSGAATTTVTIRSADDAKDVVVATVDANGNRSAVTLDLT